MQDLYLKSQPILHYIIHSICDFYGASERYNNNNNMF